MMGIRAGGKDGKPLYEEPVFISKREPKDPVFIDYYAGFLFLTIKWVGTVLSCMALLIGFLSAIFYLGDRFGPIVTIILIVLCLIFGLPVLFAWDKWKKER